MNDLVAAELTRALNKVPRGTVPAGTLHRPDFRVRCAGLVHGLFVYYAGMRRVPGFECEARERYLPDVHVTTRLLPVSMVSASVPLTCLVCYAEQVRSHQEHRARTA